MDVLSTSLKLPPHCLDRPWKGSFGGESRVPVGYGDIAPIVIKPSTANHSLADVVHDLLLLTILSEPHLPHTSLEVELQNSIKDYVEEETKKRKHEKPHAKKLRKKKLRARAATILQKRKRAREASYSTATSPPSGPQGGAPGASKVKDPRFSRRRRVKVHTEFQDAPPGTIPVPKSKTVDHDDDQDAN